MSAVGSGPSSLHVAPLPPYRLHVEMQGYIMPFNLLPTDQGAERLLLSHSEKPV